jgi:hypothetical protein
LSFAIYLWHGLCIELDKINKLAKIWQIFPSKPRRHTMYESLEITQERVARFDGEIEVADLELGNSRLGLGIIMIMAAFVGIWGVACLIGGLASTESFHEVGRSLITAFTGM